MRIPTSRVLSIALALAGCLGGCHRQKPAPSIDGISAALQRYADKTLAAPPLANEQIMLPAGADEREVRRLASAAGGAAIRAASPQGQVSLLAMIPENNIEAFKAALRKEKVPMDSPSTTTRLIEVIIGSAAASPTP